MANDVVGLMKLKDGFQNASPIAVVRAVKDRESRPEGIPKVDLTKFLMCVDVGMPPVLAVREMEPEGAGADPEGPAATAVEVAGVDIVGMLSVAEEQTVTVHYSARCRIAFNAPICVALLAIMSCLHEAYMIQAL